MDSPQSSWGGIHVRARCTRWFGWLLFVVVSFQVHLFPDELFDPVKCAFVA